VLWVAHQQRQRPEGDQSEEHETGDAVQALALAGLQGKGLFQLLEQLLDAPAQPLVMASLFGIRQGGGNQPGLGLISLPPQQQVQAGFGRVTRSVFMRNRPQLSGQLDADERG
jgi:hypothetical protein